MRRYEALNHAWVVVLGYWYTQRFCSREYLGTFVVDYVLDFIALSSRVNGSNGSGTFLVVVKIYGTIVVKIRAW